MDAPVRTDVTPIACTPSRSDRRQCRYIAWGSRDLESGTWGSRESCKFGVKPCRGSQLPEVVKGSWPPHLTHHAYTEREQWVLYVSLAAKPIVPLECAR